MNSEAIATNTSVSTNSPRIVLPMVRTDKGDYSQRSFELKINPFMDEDVTAEKIRQNRNDLYAARMKLWTQFKEKYASLNNRDYGVMDRNWEIFRVVFTVAEMFCPSRIPAIRKFVKEAVGLSKEATQDEEKEKAVHALSRYYVGIDEWISISKFAAALQRIHQEDNPKAFVTSHKAGRILRALGFIKRDKLTDGWYFWLSEDLYKKHAMDAGIEIEKAVENAKNTRKTEQTDNDASSDGETKLDGVLPH